MNDRPSSHPRDRECAFKTAPPRRDTSTHPYLETRVITVGSSPFRVWLTSVAILILMGFGCLQERSGRETTADTDHGTGSCTLFQIAMNPASPSPRAPFSPTSESGMINLPVLIGFMIQLPILIESNDFGAGKISGGVCGLSLMAHKVGSSVRSAVLPLH